MRYHIGMYGGSFCPLHVGHVEVMRQAAAMCDQLYIALSYSRSRDQVPMEYRYRWIKETLSDLENVEIICFEDTAATKEDYTLEYWQQGRDRIIEAMGCRPDVVFCGSDYPDDDDNIYRKLYGCEIHVFDRELIPVSSSDIRGKELSMWRYLPKAAQPYYVKNVYIIGTESAGKSTLTRRLAEHFNTNFVEEAGRDVCAEAGGEEYMVPEDFFKIMVLHKAAELEARKSSNKLLFIDTDVLTTLYYSKFLINESKENAVAEGLLDVHSALKSLADGISSLNSYDLVLFLEPGVFVQDGTRNEDIGADPAKYGELLRKEFADRGISFVTIGGDYEDKFCRACQVVEETFFLQEK